MTREIKFRFYSDILGSFVIPRDEIYKGALQDEHMHPMQFTGLHDKNGKEIYEGDIVEGMARHVVKNACEHQDFVANKCEVIGNIYENSDLLENSHD